ncbi:STY0301 family protein [Massilia horti]|uniref:Uncharacterized protein n=1 Tax=Massilia horti TaxID=2562153 RepID=A0A4Y9SRJ4_9BURK|nr:STY0301 family protein [Massilia horti]TFW27959.1 hypothetical protein E4O92_22620 [Massilia horti]
MAIVLASAVNAQEVECPKFFPAEVITLGGKLSGHAASARLTSANLSFAYMFSGQLYAEQTMVPPGDEKVKGGWNTEFYFTPEEKHWLVCRYGGSKWGDGNIERWEQLGQKITSCMLKVREFRHPHTPTDWSATAICK